MNRRELEKVLQAHEPRIRRIVRQHMGKFPHLDADDIHQEVLSRLWRAYESEPRGRFYSSYIKKVAYSVLIDATRKQRPATWGDPGEGWTEDSVESAATDAMPEEAERYQDLQRALGDAFEAMVPRRAQVVRFRISGLSNSEIAHMLGWSDSKVKNLATRGFEQLRTLLRERGFDYEDQN